MIKKYTDIYVHNIDVEELFKTYTREQIINYIEDLYYRNDCYSLYKELKKKNIKRKEHIKYKIK